MRDQLYIMLNVNDMEFEEESGINHVTLETCLRKAHLSVIADDGAEPYTNDYTRCAAFTRYALTPNWEEDQFFPEPSPLMSANVAQCTGNQFYSIEPRLIGAEEIIPNSWPYMVALVDESYPGDGAFPIRKKKKPFGGKPERNNAEEEYFNSCVGTIITDEWILTSSDCCSWDENDKLGDELFRTMYVLTGHHSQHDSPHPDQKKYKIIEMHLHADWDYEMWDYELYDYVVPEDGSYNNDEICLIRTEKMELDLVTAGPVCLPNQMYPPVGAPCYTASYSGNSQIPDGTWDRPNDGIAHSVNVEVVDSDICELWNTDVDMWYDFSSDSQLCVDVNACWEDYGAPLVCVENNVPVLYGIHNSPKGDCDENEDDNTESIYESIHDHMHWIEGVINGGGHNERCDYDNGWKYDGIEGCIKLWEAGQYTWSDANQICKDNNGHLVHIRDEGKG